MVSHQNHDQKVSVQDKLQALARLSAGVSHDFNNVISIMNGYATIMQNMLTQEKYDPQILQDYLDKIVTTCARGSALTKKLQMFSRHRITQSQTLDLAVIIQDSETILSLNVPPTIRLEFDAGQDPFAVECTQSNIQNIFSALIENAIHAMEEKGGCISIHVKPDLEVLPAHKHLIPDETASADFMAVRVKDEGCGMDDKIQAHMFDPFFTTSGHHNRSGLGLSIVYGLMREMGGFIDVQSAEGQGTMIDLYFPLSEQPIIQKVKLRKDQDLSAVDLSGYTALVADDEEDLVFILRECLETAGMNVLSAVDGNDALMQLDDCPGPIDILLTDILMPELDGIRLGQMFGELSPQSKIIYMSGYPSGELASASYELPQDACFLVKPVDQEMLIRLVAQSLAGDGGETILPSDAARWVENTNYSGDMS